MLRVGLDYFSHSDTGRQRRSNEDAYHARAPLFVVADGMGGAQAGEVASRVAVEAFQRDLDGDGAESAEQMLADRVREANAKIYEMSQLSMARAGMGTTITAAHVGENEVAIAHVGDSRAYRLRDDELERLTEDHSLVEEMRRRGQLTAQEADEHPQRSIITRALGPEPEVAVDTHSWRGAAGDVFLLCSDGLTSMVPEIQVAALLRGAATLQDAGRALIDAANNAGGRDNITVVLFRLEEVPDAEPAVDQPTTAGRTALSTAEVRAAVASAPPAQTVTSPKPPPPPPQARRLQPSAPAPDARRARRSRRRAMSFAIVALVVIPLGFGAYIANNAVYFIGTDNEGLVTLYRGLPYSLPAGINLYKPSYVSGVPLATVPVSRRKRLVDHQLRSKDDASDLIRALELGRVAS
ncbi:MAG TPA: Stp1/IreP family PP2C-type Ser/Thr phosphatase [Solirubrobacteraceae bacterium]|nr:Stp1/IreP family PP2C-type Ser/Thr phosphatase [Solirubrobacteraceae bacterium]